MLVLCLPNNQSLSQRARSSSNDLWYLLEKRGQDPLSIKYVWSSIILYFTATYGHTQIYMYIHVYIKKSDMKLIWNQLKSFFDYIQIPLDPFGACCYPVVLLLSLVSRQRCRTARCNEMRWSRSCPNSFSGWKVHAKRPLEPRTIGAAKTRIVGSDGVTTWLMMLIILMVDLVLMFLLDEKY